MELFDKHQSVLTKAVEALHARQFFAAFPENPAPAIYGDSADAQGQQAFKSRLGKPFDQLLQKDAESWIGEEESPYLHEKLGITYPAYNTDSLVQRSRAAFHSWRKLDVNRRAGILLESLERLRDRFFELAYATMHTTGQGFMMAFQASGPHAADRALEAIAAGYEELRRVPQRAHWEKPMGKYVVKLDKEWRPVPKGISLVIGCSTFPTWNSVGGIYGSLITGNSVIVKPHPGAILPLAIFVSEIQRVLDEEKLDFNICQLAVDTHDAMKTRALAEHPAVKIIDYTGSPEFGSYLESLSGKTVFTEKAGVNCVILDSTDDIDKVVSNLAVSLTLYSGQMCTAPQNFLVPAGGIKTAEGMTTFDAFSTKLSEAITSLVDNPKAGPFVMGAIQNDRTFRRIGEAEQMPGKVWLRSRTVSHPMFPKARMATPVVVELDASDYKLYSREYFGPIAFIVRTRNTDESIEIAQSLAEHHGAISCGAYVTNAETKARIADEMALSATPVSFNLTGNVYMNQNAAFSDFHVSGGNPAGNASFTNPQFVLGRFNWVGHREMVPA